MAATARPPRPSPPSRTSRLRPAAPLLVALVVLVAADGAAAFASIPPQTSPHDDITRDAAEAAGWPGDALVALLEAVRKPDLDEIEWDPKDDEPTRIRPTEAYRSEHHCDRIPPEDNATAFLATAAYVRQQREAFRNTTDPTDRVQALGRALHALQDCYSHSNHIHLGPAAREAFDRALLDGIGPPPDGLVLVAVVPDIERPGMPDDPHPHDAHAKDRADMNDASRERVGDRTAFEVARDAATNATRSVLEHELGRLTTEEVDSLGEARVEAPDQNPIPGWPALPAVLAVAAALRRRAVRREGPTASAP